MDGVAHNSRTWPFRLAYVTNSELPGATPGLAFSLHNAVGFQQAGADLLLVLARQPGNRDDAVAAARRMLGADTVPPLRAIAAPRLGGSRLIFYWRAFLAVAHSRRDVLITRNVNFLPWAAWLQRLRGVRVFYEAHDFWGDPAVREAPLSAGQRRNVRLERRWAPRMDGILCVSAPQGRLYQRAYPSRRVLVAPTGCKPVWTPPRPALSRRLGYVGSFVPDKYPLDLVLAGLAACADRRVTLRCVGARNPADADRIRELARRHGVSDRVEAHPWAAGEALRDLIRGMDVGVAPLADQFLNRIASPLKVLEYLAAAIPCIATRLEGVEDLIAHGVHGRLVENTPAAWAEAIAGIYADETAYRAMAAASADLAGRLGWRARAEEILKAIASTRTAP